MVKKLDISAITDRVKGEKKTDTPATPSSYNETPDYLDRRLERQNELAKGKRERRPIYRVDPNTCRIWKYHDRDYARLKEENCKDLIEGFRANGQILPAIVRSVNDGKYQYEICAGARRHWTASYLGDDLTIEIRELSDEEMFLLSDEENRNRVDISDYERALKYKQALGAHYKNQQQMAIRMGVTKDWLSRYLDLASLDKDIVKAYDQLESIKTRHMREIKPLMKNKTTAKRVLDAVRGLHKTPKTGPELIAYLKAVASPPKSKPKPVKKPAVIGLINQTPYAVIKSHTSKSVIIEIDTTIKSTLNDWKKAIEKAWDQTHREG